jgi:hypothetical protein
MDQNSKLTSTSFFEYLRPVQLKWFQRSTGEHQTNREPLSMGGNREKRNYDLSSETLKNVWLHADIENVNFPRNK